VRGVAGPALRAAGVETLVDMSDLSVIGLSAVVRRLPTIWRAMRRLEEEALGWRPHAALLVDSPGFNFRIGPWLERHGVPVFYYIAPQVWAWHRERARAMAGWVKRLAVVFPFEEPLFRDAGVPATFVGHPLLESLAPERDASALRAELGVASDARILGILPGSRRQELRAHVPVLLEAAARLARDRRDLVTVLPLAPGIPLDAVAHLSGARLVTSAAGPARLAAPGIEALVVEGRTRALMAHATACAVASGTATLETALFGTPLVVVYRMGALNYWIARRVVTLSRVGLPNIVAGTEVAPELIQDACTPERIAAVLGPWFDDPAARARAHEGLAVVRTRLGEPGASARAAALLADMLPPARAERPQ